MKKLFILILTLSLFSWVSILAAEGSPEAVDVTITWPMAKSTQDGYDYDFSPTISCEVEGITAGEPILGTEIIWKEARGINNVPFATFQPKEKVRDVTEGHTVSFFIEIKEGYSFEPTDLDYTAAAIGTNGGNYNLDYTWNGLTKNLQTDFHPNRNNEDNGYFSKETFSLADELAGNGKFEFTFSVYNLADNKQIGLSNIVLKGKLKVQQGIIRAIDITGLNGNTSTHKLTESTVVSFENGTIGISTEEEGPIYRYPIVDLKNIQYSTNTVFSPMEFSATNMPDKNVPFYIYRNDGVVNTFFSDEVEKFTYSQFDSENIRHGGVITQYIHTRDTISSINIQLIDSISFTAPITIYNKDVVLLDKELKDYVLLADDNEIILNKDIPSNLIPDIGSVLVQMKPDGIFEQPFFGRIVEQKQTDNSICLTCKDVELTEVFDSYCATFASSGSDKSIRTRSDDDYADDCKILTGNLELHFDLDPIQGVSYNPNENIAEVFGINIRADFTPRIGYLINYRGAIIVNKEYGVNLRLNIDGDYDFSTVLEIMREVNVSKQWKFFDLKLPIPSPLLSVDLELGAFLEAAASIIFKSQTTDKYKFALNWEWSNKKDLSQNNVANIIRIDNKRDVTGVVSGQFSVGLYAALNIHPFCLDIVKLSPKYKVGMKFVSSIGFNWDTNKDGPSEKLYETLEANPLGIFWSRSFDVSFESGKFGVSYPPLFPNVSILNGDTPLHTLRHVPSFENTTVKYQNGNLTADTHIKNNVIFPVQLGFALVNESNKEIVDIQYKVKDYIEQPNTMQHVFMVEHSDASYTVFPLIKWHEIEMYGHPYAKYHGLCPNEYHPHLIDLGLPSKKLWSCCNHGASSPEGSGLYLAWGESSEKSYYKYRTYSFWNDKNGNDLWDEGEFDDIGSNIQRTEYDPVYASDNGIAMPTKEEYQELISYCRWEPYTYNNQRGCLLTGPNGKQLFLPGVGMMVDYDLIENGNGRYWTSNVDPSDHCDALLLSFSDSGAEFTAGDRHNGRTIRPIATMNSSVDKINIDLPEILILKIENQIVQIIAQKECNVTIATIDGRHSIHKLTAGLNELQLKSGFYIINGQKLIVK